MKRLLYKHAKAVFCNSDYVQMCKRQHSVIMSMLLQFLCSGYIQCNCVVHVLVSAARHNNRITLSMSCRIVFLLEDGSGCSWELLRKYDNAPNHEIIFASFPLQKMKENIWLIEQKPGLQPEKSPGLFCPADNPICCRSNSWRRMLN